MVKGYKMSVGLVVTTGMAMHGKLKYSADIFTGTL